MIIKKFKTSKKHKNKNYLLIILLSIFFSKSLHASSLLCEYFSIKCEIIKHNEIITREGLLYKKYETSPYTGLIKLDKTENIDRDKYNNLEEKLISGKVIKGKKDGEWLHYRLFYKKHEIYLYKKLQYKNGELTSVSRWKPNGDLLEKYSLKNGNYEGDYEEWRESDYINESSRFKHPLSKGTYKNNKTVGCWRYSYFHSKQFGHYFNPRIKDYAEWVREVCYNHNTKIAEIKILSSDNVKYIDGKYDYKNRCYTGEWRLFDRKTRIILDRQDVGKCNKHIYEKNEFHIFFKYFEKTLKTDKSLVKYW